MSTKTTAVIVARLKNREGVYYLPGEFKRSPQGFVVIANGDVCPLDTLDVIEVLSPIFIEDGQLVCDNTVGSTNTEFTSYGREDFKEAIRRYNDLIDQKLFSGSTEDDDSSKIVDCHVF